VLEDAFRARVVLVHPALVASNPSLFPSQA